MINSANSINRTAKISLEASLLSLLRPVSEIVDDGPIYICRFSLP
jgi:hypothetical protein